MEYWNDGILLSKEAGNETDDLGIHQTFQSPHIALRTDEWIKELKGKFRTREYPNIYFPLTD
jgi:hypothetical protein